MSEHYEQSGHNIVVDEPLVDCAGCGNTTRETFECEACGNYYCMDCYRQFSNGICQDCHTKLWSLIDSVLAGIDIQGYWYTGPTITDERVVLEYISADGPTVEVHISRGE